MGSSTSGAGIITCTPLNAATGAKIWSYTTNFFVGSSPTVCNGIVYIGSDDHNFYPLDANTGKLVWSFTTGDGVRSSPTVVNDIVYVGSHDNSLSLSMRKQGQKHGAIRPEILCFQNPPSSTESSILEVGTVTFILLMRKQGRRYGTMRREEDLI